MTEFRARRKLHALQVAASDIEAWLLAKEPRAIGAWSELGAEEYARAFTAAQTAGADIVDDLYYALIDIIAGGGTEDDYASLVVPILKRKGWFGGDEGEIASRVRFIFSTNLFQARRAGKWDNYQASKTALPYLLAFTAGDSRVRHPPKSDHDHRAWDGILLPIDHPFWLEYGTGHYDFNCRCDTLQVSRSRLARMKRGITSEAELAERRARLGPPRFLGPTAPINAQLSSMVTASNGKSMPGRPPVNPSSTAAKGRDAFDAVLRARSLQDIGNQLARMRF